MIASHRNSVELTEIVLTYPQAHLDAWKMGDKSLVPEFLQTPGNVENQPAYHFGEMFTLHHYHEEEGWRGFPSYTLGPWYPRSKIRREGARVAREVIPNSLRRDFCSLQGPHEMRHGPGEPDLFLYRDGGEYKFAEVKKEGDRLGPRQLRCIAQILATLECEVDIVYLKEENRRYHPKTYRFDLDTFEGVRVP